MSKNDNGKEYWQMKSRAERALVKWKEKYDPKTPTLKTGYYNRF